jgi:AmmeMemoRadiSam system protein A
MLPQSSPLSDPERRELLALARQSLVETIVHSRMPDVPVITGRLTERQGAFVSLHLGTRLRGCVGQTRADHSLAETVAQCAIGAAVGDPRFAPVMPEEVAELTIEISVLSEPQPLRWQDIELWNDGEVGKHGLLAVRGRLRGFLLPQVARGRHWSAKRFMEETCRKAGFDPGLWQDGETQFFGFTVEAFSEAGSRQARAAAY